MLIEVKCIFIRPWWAGILWCHPYFREVIQRKNGSFNQWNTVIKYWKFASYFIKSYKRRFHIRPRVMSFALTFCYALTFGKGECRSPWRILFTPWTCETVVWRVLLQYKKVGKLLGKMLNWGSILSSLLILSACGVVEGLHSRPGCLVWILAPEFTSCIIPGESSVSSSLMRPWWFCRLDFG